MDDKINTENEALNGITWAKSSNMGCKAKKDAARDNGVGCKKRNWAVTRFGQNEINFWDQEALWECIFGLENGASNDNGDDNYVVNNGGNSDDK